MSDIVGCVVAHLRADTTPTIGIVALLGAANRINREYQERGLSPELPQIYVVTSGGSPNSSATLTRRVSIWAEATSAALCELLHDRMWDLFHDKTNYLLGTGANQCRVVISSQATPPAPERDSAAAAWECQAFYEFLITH